MKIQLPTKKQFFEGVWFVVLFALTLILVATFGK